MNVPKKIASIFVVGFLSLAGLAAVTLAVGHDGRFGHAAWAKPGEGPHGKSMCHGGPGGKPGPASKGSHGPGFLAERLSVMETELGIRANQLDAWRNFTDALQATMKRPMGPGGPGKPGMTPPGASAEPFSLAERFADNTIERAKSAEDLKTAIIALKSTLTEEQLEKVAEIEARLKARMASHHGWRRGPHGGPGHGQPETSPDTDDSDE